MSISIKDESGFENLTEEDQKEDKLSKKAKEADDFVTGAGSSIEKNRKNEKKDDAAKAEEAKENGDIKKEKESLKNEKQCYKIYQLLRFYKKTNAPIGLKNWG